MIHVHRGRLTPWTAMLTMLPEFERLEQTIDMIRRHPYYPGKELLMDECLEDIDERCRLGRITEVERGRLRDSLLGYSDN